jgi:hypothetical protein
MAHVLRSAARMRILAGCIITALLLLTTPSAHAQDTTPADGTPVASAQVSGLALPRLSPGLQEDIGKLAGSPLNREQLRVLAARIETEHPRYVAAVRTTTDTEGNARVVFVVARMRDPDDEANINAKYIVEQVEILGIDDAALDAEMRADQLALKDKPLDSELADRLHARLQAAFTDYSVNRQTSRGSQPGQIKLVFELERTEASRWLRFEPLEANVLYHSDQGWGAKLPLNMNGSHFQVVPYFAIDVRDDLIEEYSGFGFRFESRKVGTERLGASFEWSSLDQTWIDQTIAALPTVPQVPALYRNRMTLTPLLKFAITKRLTVGGGVNIAELDALDETSSDGRMANAAVGLVRFDQQWKPATGVQHDLEAAFSVRVGTDALESDLDYERYFGQAGYVFRKDRHRVLAMSQFGGITGDAPLFERFSLGDSRTLRGWNKYDITPVGGDRMVYGSVEYRYSAFALFLDSGSVWDTGTDRRVRFSTGFGFTPGPVFATVGFPLNTDEFGAVFTVGLRMTTGALGLGKY